MANRRMFAKTIIGSARFLRMGTSARLLYYDLGMYADDDGVVEAFSVMRMTGASEDDLRVLHAKGFIRVLNEDLVTLINDWNTNNLIKKDRYQESVYKELLLQIQDGSNMEPTWNPTGTQPEPQVKLSKESISKDSIRESKRVARPKYGKYANVYLSDSELNTIKFKYPYNWSEMIEYFSNYLKSTGKQYQDHYATIMKWAEEDEQRAIKKSAPALNYQQHTYTESDFDENFYYDPDRDFLKGG